MKKSILLIVLALFFSMNITGCSLFSSGEEDAETATMAESGDFAEGNDEFASDEFEMGDAKGANFESDDFDAEAMATEGADDFGDFAGEDVEVEDNFGDAYPDDEFGNTEAAGTEVAGMDSGIGGDFGDDDFGDGFDDGFGDEAAAGATAGAAAKDEFSENYIDDSSFASTDDEVDDAFGDDLGGGAADDGLFVDAGGGIPDSTMTANQEEDLFGTDTLEPVVDTPTYADTSYDTGYDAGGFDAPLGSTGSDGTVPVKKMKPAAYKRAGGNVNRLYVVRPGDNMDTIAEKIYGSTAEAEKLYSYNSHHRGRTLDVGDKVYYESPNNPNDQSMMTYYEDNNLAPSYYTSQEGDNIRKVAKNLLGHNRSWMEIYATNSNLESKGRIPAGLQIRYWPEGTVGQTMAMNDSPEPEPAMPATEPEPMPEPEPIAMDEPDEMPEPEPIAMDDPGVPAMDEPTEMANLDEPDALGEPEEMTPPPAMGSANTPPPPPPTAQQPVAPPPPPSGPKPMKKPSPPKVSGGPVSNDPLAAISGDDNMIMGALGGLLLLAAIIMLIFIRRSRAKRVNFSQTQV